MAWRKYFDWELEIKIGANYSPRFTLEVFYQQGSETKFEGLYCFADIFFITISIQLANTNINRTRKGWLR